MKHPSAPTIPSIEGFVSIPVSTLRVDLVTDFSLWLQTRPGAPPVLYRAGDLTFTEDIRDRLQQHGVTRLYVQNDDRVQLRRYIEENIEALLADASVPVEERSEMMYESAQGLVREAMDDPRSGKMVERSDGAAHGELHLPRTAKLPLPAQGLLL